MNSLYPENAVAQNSRVRIIRNLKNHKFPWRMTKEEISSVDEQILSAIYDSGIGEDELRIINLSSLSDGELKSLTHKHIISQKTASNKMNKILLLSKDESVSILLCDDDHLKIQVIKQGCSADTAFEIADSFASVIESALPIAFDEHLGFLTANPADIGTGMKASVLLKIPALERCGEIPSIMESVSRIGLNLSPFSPTSDGEALYVLSNTITLGISEDDAIANLDAIARQICNYEREYSNGVFF